MPIINTLIESADKEAQRSNYKNAIQILASTDPNFKGFLIHEAVASKIGPLAGPLLGLEPADISKRIQIYKNLQDLECHWQDIIVQIHSLHDNPDESIIVDMVENENRIFLEINNIKKSLGWSNLTIYNSNQNYITRLANALHTASILTDEKLVQPLKTLRLEILLRDLEEYTLYKNDINSQQDLSTLIAPPYFSNSRDMQQLSILSIKKNIPNSTLLTRPFLKTWRALVLEALIFEAIVLTVVFTPKLLILPITFIITRTAIETTTYAQKIANYLTDMGLLGDKVPFRWFVDIPLAILASPVILVLLTIYSIIKGLQLLGTAMNSLAQTTWNALSTFNFFKKEDHQLPAENAANDEAKLEQTVHIETALEQQINLADIDNCAEETTVKSIKPEQMTVDIKLLKTNGFYGDNTRNPAMQQQGNLSEQTHAEETKENDFDTSLEHKSICP